MAKKGIPKRGRGSGAPSRRDPLPPLGMPPEPSLVPPSGFDGIRKRLFTPIKIPAWALILYAIFSQIPDFFSRIQWWIESVGSTRSYIGLVTSMIASPYFSAALVIIGVLWLLFVGEPKVGVLRSYCWLYVGWSMVALLVIAVIISCTFGYAVSVLGPRQVTPDQKKRFINASRLIAGGPYKIYIDINLTCPDCAVYAGRLEALVGGSPKWQVEPGGNVGGPNYFAPSGIAVLADSGASSAVKGLTTALDAASIRYNVINQPINIPSASNAVHLVVMPKSDE